jgi:hypothetical protein
MRISRKRRRFWITVENRDYHYLTVAARSRRNSLSAVLLFDFLPRNCHAAFRLRRRIAVIQIPILSVIV